MSVFRNHRCAGETLTESVVYKFSTSPARAVVSASFVYYHRAGTSEIQLGILQPFQTVSGRRASNPTVVAASPAAPPRCMRASLRCRSGDLSLMEERWMGRWMSSVLRVIMEIRPSSSLVAVGIILACIDFKRCSAYTRVKYC